MKKIIAPKFQKKNPRKLEKDGAREKKRKPRTASCFCNVLDFEEFY